MSHQPHDYKLPSFHALDENRKIVKIVRKFAQIFAGTMYVLTGVILFVGILVNL